MTSSKKVTDQLASGGHVQWFPARLHLSGRRIDSRALLYGTIPPAAGPARIQWCVEAGQAAHRKALKGLGATLLDLIEYLPGGLVSLPDIWELHSTHLDVTAHARVGRGRVATWFALRERVQDRADRVERVAGVQILSEAWTTTAESARAAASAAAEAHHCLRAALTETRAVAADAAELSGAWERLADRLITDVANAHALNHRIGELVGGLFGCTAESDGDVWMRRCVVDLMHYDFGFSAGFTTRHVCSICDKSLATCPHLLGGRYEVTASQDTDGNCTACGAADCAHEVGSTVSVTASPVMVDAAIHELSATPSPRDPRLRLLGVEVPIDVMRADLGVVPSKEAEIWHHQCMYPCDGFVPGDILVQLSR